MALRRQDGKAVEVVTGAAKQVFGTDDPASLERALAADPAKALEFERIVLEAEGQERERKHQHQETLARMLISRMPAARP